MKHFWIGLVVLAFALGCAKNKKRSSRSGSSMSVEKFCEASSERKYARPKYDKRWKEEPEKMAKKKAARIKRCTEKLSKAKVEHPEHYKRLTHCISSTTTYRELGDCAQAVEREVQEVKATAALKEERKWFDVPTLGVKLNAPASYTLELSDGRAHLKGPGGLLFLGVDQCDYLGTFKERGGGPKNDYRNPEPWCARGEAAVRQIATGSRTEGTVSRVEAVTNGADAVLVEIGPGQAHSRNQHNLLVYLAREKDAVTCKALLDDFQGSEAKLAREVCSSMRPL